MLKRFIEYFEKITWAYAIAIVVLGAAYFYFTLDQTELTTKLDTVNNVQQKISDLEKKIQEAEQFEKEYEVKKKHYVYLLKQLEDSQGALPTQFFLPDLLSDLLKEAKQLEVEITSIVPDPKEEQQELYSSLGFTIEAKGTFLQFFIFFDRLAGMKRLMYLKSYNMVLDPERPDVTLGGEEGAFASQRLRGGRTVYPGITAKIKVITYRYRGEKLPSGPGGG